LFSGVFVAEALLEIDNLVVSYDAITALYGVSLKVAEGSVVCLIGANGAGKSTVLRTVSGLKRPDSGSVRFKGMDLARVPTHQIVRLGVSQSPEGRGVFPDLSVEENLKLGAYIRDDREGIKCDLERISTIFPRLADRRRQAAGTLSGGEQQMLAIGRALMSKPSLLLLDEPSLGLAPQVVEDIFETVEMINKEGTTVLLVEQNANLALEVSQYAYVLETGRVLLEGVAATVRNDPRVKAAYLGK
jgi:branched-chain amino acid transport system ATP-binding protein